jgi:1-acyl-sn-glycerol-3-phosphate acyltransferase
VLGFGAKASFSVFVDRNDKDSRRHTREQIADLMHQGFSVLIFPEGTTFEGPGVKQLKPGPFQIAQDGNFTVVPVALEYQDKEDAWVGDDTFQRHFLVCFRKPHIRMKIKFGEPRPITNWETDMLEVQSWLDAETRRMRGEFDLELV